MPAEKLTLRPRVRRLTRPMDLAMAVILGGVSGIYIFKDTMQRWRAEELLIMQKAEGTAAAAPNAAPVPTKPTST